MKFLIDNGVSPIVAKGLVDHGQDAVHVRDIGLHAADDDVLFDLAAQQDRIIVSIDTDFGTLLALRAVAKPSVILFRSPIDRWPLQQLNLLLTNLEALDEFLTAGAIVVFDEQRIRVRGLPIQRA